MEELGAHDRVLRPLSKMYGSLRRHLRCGDGIGRNFSATNGILQGCPVSVIMLNAIMMVWAKAVESEVPHTETRTYADDLQAVTRSRASITKIAGVTDDFAELTGQTINTNKCRAFTTEVGGRKVVKVRDGSIKWSHHVEVLGANLVAQGTGDCGKIQQDISDACAYTGKVRWLPLGFHGRATVLQQGMIPKALYASSVNH
eukprot:9641906-Karenia_brevis.AAC.1